MSDETPVASPAIASEELVMKVAQAICEAERGEGYFELLAPYPTVRLYRKMAAAAIAAAAPGLEAAMIEGINRADDEEYAAGEAAERARCADIAFNYGPSRPRANPFVSIIQAGRWEGEQAASTNIAAAIRSMTRG